MSPGKPTSCDGQRATIVGTDCHAIHGTSKRDVIVTNGAYRVFARGGDDLICVTKVDDSLGIKVVAGPGDDTVDASGSKVGADVDLGPGDDHFRGSPDGDQVTDGSGDDVIDTGAGGDEMDSAVDPNAQWDGGPGFDAGNVPAGTDQDHTWRYDLASGTSYRDGQAVSHFKNFEAYGFVDTFQGKSVTITGGPANDYVQLVIDRHQISTTPVTIALGGGKDRLQLLSGDDEGDPGMNSFVFDGGAGEDQLDVESDAPSGTYLDTSIDLSAGNFNGYAMSGTSSGVEDA